jgi:hypothetical protein
MRIITVLTGAVWWLLCCAAAMAANEDGSAVGCDSLSLQTGWRMENGRRVFNQEDIRAIAYQLDTPVFTAATGNALGPRKLRFSEYVIIVDPGDGTPRIKVNDIGGQPLGWLNRADMLCRIFPLADAETKLYRRAVVRTAADVKGTAQQKNIYQSLTRRCVGDACIKVSRFQWYFIYAELQGMYLISAAGSLGNSTQLLLGWLPAEDALNWNTSLGLRPVEQLADSQPEKFVCVYETISDLSGNTGCKQVLGGKRWFNLDARMAVLKESRDHVYDVAFSNAFRNPDEAGRDPTAAINTLKRIDVFFVIDGTQSMQAAIDGVKNIVDKLKEKTKNKFDKNSVIRFGFRVYRDSVRGSGDGVENSERLILSNSCDKSNDEEFAAAFRKVNAIDPPGDDDYPENVYGGLVQASTDLAACPENTKIVFVIGDNGYDPAKQKARGFKAYTEQGVAQFFKKGVRFRTQPIVIFIQTPSESNNVVLVPVTAKPKYDNAYQEFERQARAILKGIYDGSDVPSAAQNFIPLQPGRISDAVIRSTTEKVDTFIRPDVLSQIITRMDTGQSLVASIEALSKDSSLNIPIMYLQHIQSSLCEQLAARCRESVFETVNTAHLKRSDDLEPEVMLTREQLISWLTVLGRFNARTRTMASGSESRQLIANALARDISEVLQIDVPSSGMELAKLFQFQAGIPDAANSKLMQYTIDELARVPPCEIDFIVHYASRKRSILEVILNNEGRVVPVYEETTWPEGTCPGLSAKGKKIPQIKGEINQRRLNDPPTGGTNYTFLRRRGEDIVFWIPVRYLP